MPWKPLPFTRWEWFVPALILALGTVAAWVFDLDRTVAQQYFDPAGPPYWPTGSLEPWDFLYMWAVVPAMVLAVAGIGLLALGWTRGWPWPRRAGLLILLSLAVGPLILTNGVFHEFWGRPRPRQVIEFAGDRPFQPVLIPTFHRDEQGFPTGHAVGGFSLLIGYFVLRNRSRAGAWAMLGAGLALGGIIAWARITQGGHFLSDGLWSAGVIWFSTLGVDAALAWRAREHPVPAALPGPGKRWAIWIVSATAGVALLVGYLAYLPIQKRSEWRVPIPPGVRTVRIQVAVVGDTQMDTPPHATELRLYTTLSGRGWPWASLIERRAGPVIVDGEMRLHYVALPRGTRATGRVSTAILAPPGLPVQVEPLTP